MRTDESCATRDQYMHSVLPTIFRHLLPSLEQAGRMGKFKSQ
jgi:hypothetical protein